MPNDPILVADGVHRHFAGVTAVDVEHLAVERGKITALIGPNGAGKTTFFNLLTGFDRPQAGSWSFDGRPVAGLAPYRVARLGMVRTFQLTKVLGRLTVLENMLLGSSRQSGEKLSYAILPLIWKSRDRSDVARAMEILGRFKLDAKAADYAASLSGGQRKLLEMARAIMSEPTMVMLDEPMAGVNPALTQSLLHHIKDLKEQGMTVLFVEHDMHMVRNVADRVVVMAEGKIIASGAPDEVLSSTAVVDAYLGAHHDTDLRKLIQEMDS
ncbi:ABC transporter ATP-binding protein [Actinoplanes sp. NPDC051861]|uniref:ABC transporter ATP-binding protein n=1 Tax=Actinoplanes sp. NPDC051861 TaxID=3155170 RepID=UPI00343CDDB6